jgi:hypothetical protein
MNSAMPVTRQQFVLLLGTTAFYLVGQLLAGTDVEVAALFSVAILFGTLSVFAGGGLKSAFGFINAMLIGKFLLIGIAIKIMLLEPADGTLNAPHTTALVMAIGFLGLFLGTMTQGRISCPQSCSMNRPFSTRMLLSFSIVLFAVSYAAYFASMIPATQGQGIQTGGWLGIARMLGSLKSLAIVPAMLYLWRTNAKRWMTNPVILGMLAWSVLVGIFSTGKQDAMEPIVFYALVGFLRYGWQDKRLWSIIAIGAAYYAIIVFPYSQYVRYAGGREGTFEHRAETTKNGFLRIASDSEFRSTVVERVSKQPSYFSSAQFAPFSRLAMVGEADRLISATERRQAFTGWKTIAWGFELLTPSFLYPDKPIFEAGNYLGHIGGDVNPSDTSTQISYGVMANLYNAFSLPGVLFGTILFFAGFYYWIRIFLGDPRWDGGPTTSTLWFVWLIALYQHSVVESSLSGNIASLSFPFAIALLGVFAKWFCLLLPREIAEV